MGRPILVKEELCENVVEVRRKRDRVMAIGLVFGEEVVRVTCDYVCVCGYVCACGNMCLWLTQNKLNAECEKVVSYHFWEKGFQSKS